MLRCIFKTYIMGLGLFCQNLLHFLCVNVSTTTPYLYAWKAWVWASKTITVWEEEKWPFWYIFGKTLLKAHIVAGSLFLKKNPKGWPWWSFESFDGYRNFLAGLMIWYIWWSSGLLGVSLIPFVTLGILAHRTSDDDWGVQSPPKRKVFRFHYHSQKVSQDP